jgi:hypothetical protein
MGQVFRKVQISRTIAHYSSGARWRAIALYAMQCISRHTEMIKTVLA